MQRHRVQLLVATRARQRLLELAPHVGEGLAQRDVDVLVLHPVHRELVAGHGQVQAHAERPALLLVLVQQRHVDAAAHDVVPEAFEVMHLAARLCLQGRGGRHVVENDLQGQLHRGSLPPLQCTASFLVSAAPFLGSVSSSTPFS